jgi:hypothetical protein
MRAYISALGLTVAALVLLPAASSLAAQAPACPNEQVRVQNRSANLPDCRSYELVSPLDKNGGDIDGIDEVGSGGVVQASPDGSKITYVSLSSFGGGPQGAPVGDQYLSTRGGEGWSTQNITLALATPELAANQGTPYKAFSSDLAASLVLNGVHNGEAVPGDESALGGAPKGYEDFYRRDLEDGGVQALITTEPPEPHETFEPRLEGDAATPDLSHIVLRSTAALTPGATAGPPTTLDLNIYEWADGALQAVNVPPEPSLSDPGETLLGSRLGSGESGQGHTISDDGSRVFWTGPEENLFVREGLGTATPRTVQLDREIGGGGVFLTASTDGSKVFFTKGKEDNGDLYEYDLNENKLTDLAAGAGVEGVLGSSDDGSYVYFVASGGFDGATSHTCELTNAATQCNLYLWHEGAGITFIATLTGADEGAWSPELASRPARVTPDGRQIVFTSAASLTGYDNNGPNCVPVVNPNGVLTGYSPGSCEEVYTYKAGGEVGSGLVCVSCNPSGAAPIGPSGIPAATDYVRGNATYDSRVLSADGSRVFFDSTDALVPADTNEAQDVYEWERGGTPTCTRAGGCDTCTQTPGCIGLISGGVSNEPSSFLDASEDGSDVFFLTRQQLVPGDTDQEVDVYDAHEGGGFTQPTTTACTGTGCQGLPGAQPTFATPASGTFEGVGNLPAPGPAVTKPAVKPKALTSAQKLAKALKACKKAKPKARRVSCEKAARKKYAPVKRAKGKS